MSISGWQNSLSQILLLNKSIKTQHVISFHYIYLIHRNAFTFAYIITRLKLPQTDGYIDKLTDLRSKRVCSFTPHPSQINLYPPPPTPPNRNTELIPSPPSTPPTPNLNRFLACDTPVRFFSGIALNKRSL